MGVLSTLLSGRYLVLHGCVTFPLTVWSGQAWPLQTWPLPPILLLLLFFMLAQVLGPLVAALFALARDR